MKEEPSGMPTLIALIRQEREIKDINIGRKEIIPISQGNDAVCREIEAYQGLSREH